MGNGCFAVALLFLSYPLAVSADTHSSVVPMDFNRCEQAQAQIITQLNSRPSRIEKVSDALGQKAVRVYSNGMDVLITCDSEKRNVLVEVSTNEPGMLSVSAAR